MKQLVLNIENPAVLPVLRRLVALIDGVSIARTPHTKKNGKTDTMPALDRAIEDVRCGNVFHAESVEDLFNQLDA